MPDFWFEVERLVGGNKPERPENYFKNEQTPKRQRDRSFRPFGVFHSCRAIFNLFLHSAAERRFPGP